MKRKLLWRLTCLSAPTKLEPLWPQFFFCWRSIPLGWLWEVRNNKEKLFSVQPKNCLLHVTHLNIKPVWCSKQRRESKNAVRFSQTELVPHLQRFYASSATTKHLHTEKDLASMFSSVALQQKEKRKELIHRSIQEVELKKALKKDGTVSESQINTWWWVEELCSRKAAGLHACRKWRVFRWSCSHRELSPRSCTWRRGCRGRAA